MDTPPSNIRDIYKQQGWNDDAAITGDINSGGWKSKVPGGGAASTGNSARLDLAKSLTDQLTSVDSTNKAAQNDARTKLIDYYSSLEDPTARYTRISGDVGLSDQQALVDSLTRNVMNTQDLIDGLVPDVNKRVGNFLVNDTGRASILAREQDPLIKNLTKLERDKQYEEIGLQGKQQLVATLIGLAQQADAQGAKPFELGVDYTTEDRNTAIQLFQNIIQTQMGAYSADVTDANAAKRQEDQQAFEAEQNSLNRDATLKGYQVQGDITQRNQSALEQLKKTLGNDSYQSRTSGGSGGDDKAVKQATEDAWNNIVAGSRTENDVYMKIKQNEAAFKAAGININDLYSKHAALAAKVGRTTSPNTGLIRGE